MNHREVERELREHQQEPLEQWYATYGHQARRTCQGRPSPRGTLRVHLMHGRTITVPPVWYPRLLHATPEQRLNWRVCGGGYGIHQPDIEEDLSSEGLLRDAPTPRGHLAQPRRACPP